MVEEESKRLLVHPNHKGHLVVVSIHRLSLRQSLQRLVIKSRGIPSTLPDSTAQSDANLEQITRQFPAREPGVGNKDMAIVLEGLTHSQYQLSSVRHLSFGRFDRRLPFVHLKAKQVVVRCDAPNFVSPLVRFHGNELLALRFPFEGCHRFIYAHETTGSVVLAKQ